MLSLISPRIFPLLLSLSVALSVVLLPLIQVQQVSAYHPSHCRHTITL